jgi:hypothetical protein
MTLGTGYDSAFPPTLVQARAAKAAAGPISTWWGFYLPDIPNTDPLNTWTPAQMQVLLAGGWLPVPIVVPTGPNADPISEAIYAYDRAVSFGLNPEISVCYNGEHIQVSGPVWLPIPGPKPTTVGPGSAIQYGGGNIQGLDVDMSVSAEDFPASTALVCDLEHKEQYTAAWYASFQETIAALAKLAPNPSPPIRKRNKMILVVLNDTGSFGAKNSQWILSVGSAVPVVDDFTAQLGNPMPCSNNQALEFLSPKK